MGRQSSLSRTRNWTGLPNRNQLYSLRYDALISESQISDGGESDLFCHSERSEESLFLFMELNRREILRFAQNDKINYFFRSLFRNTSATKGGMKSQRARRSRRPKRRHGRVAWALRRCE